MTTNSDSTERADPNPPQYGFAATTDGSKRAIARPWASCLELRTAPQDPAIVECVGVAFQEELMHSARQRLGLVRALGLLDRYKVRSFYAHLRGERPLGPTVKRIRDADRAWTQLYEGAENLIETVDKFLTQQALQYDIEIRHIAERFGDSDTDIEEYADQLREKRDRQHSRITDKEEYGREYKRIYRRLELLTDEHGYRTTLSVVDAALDLPFAVEPVSVDGVPTLPAATVDPVERFKRALKLAFKGITSEEKLRTQLWQMREQGRDRAGPPATFRDVSMPLLDVPLNLSTTAGSNERALRAMNQAPTVMAYVLSGAFRGTGAFGGAFYNITSNETGWLVNPFVANKPVDVKHAADYAELWERRFFGRRVVSQLLSYARSDDGMTGGDRVTCRLCTWTRGDRKCGGSECAYSAYVKRVNELREAFEDELTRQGLRENVRTMD